MERKPGDMQFRLLGQLEILDGEEPLAVRGHKRRALLAVLLLNANRVVSSDRLIEQLWGESPPATAAKGLQVHVSQLRKELRGGRAEANGDLLRTQASGYVLQVEPGQLDIQLAQDGLERARLELAGGDPQAGARLLRETLELWRGPPLADFAYEPFAQQEAARLEELRLAVVETRIEADLAAGDHSAVVGELESLVHAHPLRETFSAQLMLALYRCGRQGEALAAYRRAERTLREELGIEPTPALRELEAQILAQDPALEAPRRRRGASPRRAPAEDQPSRRRGASLPGPVLLTAGAVVLLGAVALAVGRQIGDRPSDPGVPLDAATNSVVALDASARKPDLAFALPGRPTGLVAAGGSVWASTVDSAALAGVSVRQRSLRRTVPLSIAPEAVAVGEGSVWVADGGRGVLAGVRPGYQSISRRFRYPRVRETPAVAGRQRVVTTSLATAAGAVWVTNGSDELTRIDPSSRRRTSVPAGVALNDVSAGAGAVWGLSTAKATVVRIDPRSGRVTDRIPIVARPGGASPTPLRIAASRTSVWVLNGNTATVTRIDPVARGVVTTVELGVERVPNDIAAAGDAAWTANSDGTLSRVEAGSPAARSVWVGESLEEVAVDGSRVWATTTALDQKLPGGSR